MGHVAVLGAGNGGFAAASDIGRRGLPVALYNRGLAALEAVREQGGIRYRGALGEGFAPVRLVTTDIAAAVSDAELILVCAPATAHAFLARALAPVLRSGQPLVLNPGNMLGSLAFLVELRAAGWRGRARIGETGTLTYICRKPDPGAVNITSVLRDAPFAAFPGRQTEDLLAAARPAQPMLKACRHVLEAGFANVNATLHPPTMLLAAAWIEHSGGDFRYYYDAATPAVARLLEALDRERMAVARGWGVPAPSFLELFAAIGSTSAAAREQGSYLRALLDSEPNREIKAPPSLDHRYMHEDIPHGVVPLADLGRAAGVPTPVTEAVITIACTITGRDYRSEGRTLQRLGLAGLTQERVVRLLEDGEA